MAEKAENKAGRMIFPAPAGFLGGRLFGAAVEEA
jgi:hypothetical protein